MKILWVEDKIDEVIAIFEALCRRGHTITVANSRQQAEQVLDGGWQGELVILDSFLPNEEGSPSHTGPDILAGLKAGRWGQWGVDVKVVFITGFMQDVQKALNESGTPASIIVKPVSTDSALRALADTAPNINITLNDNAKAAVAYGAGNAELNDASQTLPLPLSDELASDLRRIARAWLSDTGEHSLEASQRLISVLAAGNSAEEQQKEIEGFRGWVAELGADVRQALATGASVVGIAAPFLQALGLM